MNSDFVSPLLANALTFAFEKATIEGKMTITALVILSLFSWTVMITKARQLFLAHRASAKFFGAYRSTRSPLDLHKKNDDFTGSPAFEVYEAGAEELEYQIKSNPVQIRGTTRISAASLESVKVVLEREVSAQALSLERGMIILSTAVSGGPFIGLLGTVWGVMETFSGVAKAQTASLTAMAPGVAGALIATVVGLLVAIPAMFAYNFMVTKVRSLTQELDNFTSEYATALSHLYVDNRSLTEELREIMGKSDDDSGDRLSVPSLS